MNAAQRQRLDRMAERLAVHRPAALDDIDARLARLTARALAGDEDAVKRLARANELLTLARARRDAAQGRP